jgi:hypothetical protein
MPSGCHLELSARRRWTAAAAVVQFIKAFGLDKHRIAVQQAKDALLARLHALRSWQNLQVFGSCG